MKKKVGNTRDITAIVSVERSRNSRRRSVSRPHTYISEHPSQNERFGIYGIFKREKCVVDISKMGEYEVCIPKSRILV